MTLSHPDPRARSPPLAHHIGASNKKCVLWSAYRFDANPGEIGDGEEIDYLGFRVLTLDFATPSREIHDDVSTAVLAMCATTFCAASLVLCLSSSGGSR